MRPALFLSASVPTGKKPYPDSQRHFMTARPQWIRDAVLALARECFTFELDLIFGAHPSISPMVLTVVDEFLPTPTPRVHVFQSEFFRDKFPQETLELADGTRGKLHTTPREADQDQSLLTMRGMMFASRGLVGAVFVGGMDGIEKEARLFKAKHPVLPTYSVASVGGAARDLLDKPTAPLPGVQRPPYTAAEFCGSPVAPVDEQSLREELVGYTRLARTIVAAVRSALQDGSLQPFP